MSSWIKIRTKLRDDGRLLIASKKCNASSVTVFGALVTLWCYADEHADENGVLYGWTAETVNKKVDLENFAQSLPESWIDLTGEWVKLPEYQEHNGTTAKSRVQTARRVSNARRNARTVTNVTPEPLPDKIREDKIRLDKNIKKTKAKKNTPSVDDTITNDSNIYDKNHTTIQFKHLSNFKTPLPHYLDNEKGKELLETWLTHKSERRESYKPTGFKSFLSNINDWDMQRLERAVKHSTSANYAGLFEPKGNQTFSNNGLPLNKAEIKSLKTRELIKKHSQELDTNNQHQEILEWISKK